jgi:MFS superfamily sulfate permease-like transporter
MHTTHHASTHVTPHTTPVIGAGIAVFLIMAGHVVKVFAMYFLGSFVHGFPVTVLTGFVHGLPRSTIVWRSSAIIRAVSEYGGGKTNDQEP